MIEFVIGSIASVLISEFSKKPKLAKGGSILLAPNGKPSNLNRGQWHLVRTPEFKAWFGDWENDPANASKVVDENGEPLICYHGTRKRGEKGIFSIFDIEKGGESNTIAKVGFWFTPNAKFAYNFAENTWWGKDKPYIYEVFLCMKNPKIYFSSPDVFGGDSYEKFRTDIYKIAGQTEYHANVGGIGIALKNAEETIRTYRNNLISSGFDGIIIKNTRFDRKEAGGNNDQYVAIFSNKIKTAIGINTTFDINNPDIRFKKGGSILLAPNGKPSNLTPKQYKLVRTKAFKDWFGDWENNPSEASKVVDENGEPLVCEHKTNFEFSVFDKNKVGTKSDTGYFGKGFYFSPKGKGSFVYGKIKMYCFINSKTPKYFLSYELSPKNTEDAIILKGDYDFSSIPPIKLSAKESKNIQEIVVFNSNQIKLADGTNTTFDGSNPDIRFKKGGLFDRDTMAGGHQYTVFFDLNGRRTSRKVFANTSSSAESWIKFQYPEARNISSRKEY